MDQELYSWVCERDLCYVGFFFLEMGISPAEMTRELFTDFLFDEETAILSK
jgi:hypothetical protein